MSIVILTYIRESIAVGAVIHVYWLFCVLIHAHLFICTLIDVNPLINLYCIPMLLWYVFFHKRKGCLLMAQLIETVQSDKPNIYTNNFRFHGSHDIYLILAGI